MSFYLVTMLANMCDVEKMEFGERMEALTTSDLIKQASWLGAGLEALSRYQR